MDDQIKKQLTNSLFSQRSLFDQDPYVVPDPPLPVGRVVLTHKARIEDLIGDAIAAIGDNHPEEALDALEEIGDLIRNP